MWALAKQTCESLQKSIMLLGLDFMPLDQIDHMSLNGLRRQVATHDKAQTKTLMGEPLVPSDMEHNVSTRGGLRYHFFHRKTIYGVSSTLGFWSMRHSAISKEEVDFQEHCVGNFWGV